MMSTCVVQAAQAGVRISNPSTSDPIVMLKHFGPHAEAGKIRPQD